MNTTSHCPRCCAPLRAHESPGGLCPKCLLSVAMGESPVIQTAAGRPAPPPPTLDQLAPHFPQLELHELIGRGGMGAVYKAVQTGLGRPVALKILTVDHTADPTFAERFLREARAMASLAHPNIAGVYDSGQAGPWYYLLLELVDGPNLRQVLRNGDLRPTEALSVVTQICSALEYAHGEGVVHRDIKPENVLLDARGRVKIVDFGLAKLLGVSSVEETLTRTGQAMGTLHYMAPEQVRRPLEVDHRADIYSLGVVFYELLTGDLPMGRFEAPSKRAQTDVRLDDVVFRTLEQDPARRYQDVRTVREDVEHISSTEFAPGATAEHAKEVAGRRAVHRERAARRHSRRHERATQHEPGRSGKRAGAGIVVGCLVAFGLGGMLMIAMFIAFLGGSLDGDKREPIQATIEAPRAVAAKQPVQATLHGYVDLKNTVPLALRENKQVKAVVLETWNSYRELEREHASVHAYAAEPWNQVIIERFPEARANLVDTFVERVAPAAEEARVREAVERRGPLHSGKRRRVIAVRFAGSALEVRTLEQPETRTYQDDSALPADISVLHTLVSEGVLPVRQGRGERLPWPLASVGLADPLLPREFVLECSRLHQEYVRLEEEHTTFATGMVSTSEWGAVPALEYAIGALPQDRLEQLAAELKLAESSVLVGSFEDPRDAVLPFGWEAQRVQVAWTPDGERGRVEEGPWLADAPWLARLGGQGLVDRVVSLRETPLGWDPADFGFDGSLASPAERTTYAAYCMYALAEEAHASVQGVASELRVLAIGAFPHVRKAIEQHLTAAGLGHRGAWGDLTYYGFEPTQVTLTLEDGSYRVRSVGLTYEEERANLPALEGRPARLWALAARLDGEH